MYWRTVCVRALTCVYVTFVRVHEEDMHSHAGLAPATDGEADNWWSGKGASGALGRGRKGVELDVASFAETVVRAPSHGARTSRCASTISH